VHASRAAQAGGGFRGQRGPGLNDQRSVGIASETELFDAVLGFLLVDFACDDHATTRHLRRGGAESLMLEELDEIGRRSLWEGVPVGR
jgi:hypothetical protein